MTDDREEMDLLGRYWDELAQGKADTRLSSAGHDDRDPTLVEALQRFHELGTTPPPGAARDRVWRELRAQMDIGQREQETLVQATAIRTHPHIAPISNGRSDPRHRHPASQPTPIALRRRVGSVFSLAAAAVLLLALAGGLVAIRFGAPRSDDAHFGSIPAAQVSPEASPPAGPVAFLWQTRGDPNDPLGNASHLAVAPDGTVWVADGDHDRFLIFSPDGRLREAWGETGSGEGQFDFTTTDWNGNDHGAIAFAPDGSFYVVDTGNHRIQKFGPDRGFLLAWGSEGSESGQFRSPNDVAVDGQGRVYVVDSVRYDPPADAATGAVQVFDADGRFLAEWGLKGFEPGQVYDPFGIGLDPADGTLLVVEASGNRVQRFTPEGELLAGWGGSGSGDGRFSYALEAAVDGQGRVFVTDYANHRVQVFDRDGDFLAAWGTVGDDPGEFIGPVGVAVGADGTVYVTDEANGLQAFRLGALPEPAAPATPDATPPAGPVAFLWETNGDPADPLGNPPFLAVAPDGNIWVTDGDHDRFQIFAPDGTYLENWGETGAGEGQFDFDTVGWGGYPHGAVAFAPDGTFYVADPGNNRVEKFGPDRRFLLAWGSDGQEPGQFRTANDLVVDGQGRVYVLDTNRDFQPAVQVFDAGGRFLAAWGERGGEPGHLSGPSGIGLDPDGTILIAEYDGNRVQRFTPEGEFLQVIGEPGFIDDGLISHAMDAAVDEQGRIYVTDYSNSRVQVFDADGAFLAAWGTYGSDPGEFADPLGVAVGGDGTVYVTDEGKRLQAFRVGDLPEPVATPAS